MNDAQKDLLIGQRVAEKDDSIIKTIKAKNSTTISSIIFAIKEKIKKNEGDS